jgi:hypothetical protein
VGENSDFNQIILSSYTQKELRTLHELGKLIVSVPGTSISTAQNLKRE